MSLARRAPHGDTTTRAGWARVVGKELDGAGEGIRTLDLLFTKQLLYH